MNKKIIALGTAGIYFYFCSACIVTTTVMIPQSKIAEERGEIKIANIVSSKGEIIELDPDARASVRDGSVIGYFKPERYSISQSEIDKSTRKSPDYTNFILKDGREIQVFKDLRSRGSEIVFQGRKLMKIPIAEIKTMSITKVDAKKSLTNTLLLSCAVWLGFFIYGITHIKFNWFSLRYE